MSALTALLNVDAAFRREIGGGEPTFEVRVNDALEGTFTRSKLIADNLEGAPELAEWAKSCSVGNFFQTGGGAAPIVCVTRIS